MKAPDTRTPAMFGGSWQVDASLELDSWLDKMCNPAGSSVSTRRVPTDCDLKISSTQKNISNIISYCTCRIPTADALD